jgi:hypothetical protein
MMYVTEEDFNKINAIYRLRKVLARRKTIYQSDAYRACGIGLTLPEFEVIVQGFIEADICTRVGKVLTFNPNIAEWEKKLNIPLEPAHADN